MTAKPKLRIYKEGDEHEIVPLLKTAFQGWPFFDIDCSPEDHWRWRYLDNPKKSLLIVIEAEDRIVACGHNILNEILINGKKILTAYGTDGCVHPEYQGKGLSKKLTATLDTTRRETGVDFTYMITINPRIINSSARKIAFPQEFPHKVLSLTRIDDVNRHIQMTDVKNEYLMKMRHYLDTLILMPLKDPPGEIEIIEAPYFDSNIERFLDKLNKSHDFILHRNLKYLNWRYCDPRAGNYTVTMAKKDEETRGYCVSRIKKLEKYHTGYIVDLLTIPGELDVAEALLSSVLWKFKEKDVNLAMSQVIKDHPFESLFKKYGFHGEQGERRVFYNYFGGEDLKIGEISPHRFHFSYGAITGI